MYSRSNEFGREREAKTKPKNAFEVSPLNARTCLPCLSLPFSSLSPSPSFFFRLSFTLSFPSQPLASLPSTLPLLVALFRRCEIQCQRRRKRGTTVETHTGGPTLMRTARPAVPSPVYPSYDRTNGQRCRLPMALPARCNEWERGEPVIPPKVAFENQPACSLIENPVPYTVPSSQLSS